MKRMKLLVQTRVSLAIRLGLCAVVLLGGLAESKVAHGLDFPSELLVYQEDFELEVGYPTTPEVNELGIGGFYVIAPWNLPVPTGSALHVAGPTPLSTVTAALIGPDLATLAEESIGVRTTVSGITAEPDSVGFFSVQAGFDIGAINNAGVVAQLELIRSPAGATTIVLAINEFEGGIPGGPEISMTLPAGETSALMAGAAATIDLFVDRRLGTATASVEIAGFPVHSIGPYGLGVVTDPAFPVDNFALLLTSLDAAIEGDFEHFEVYRAFESSFAVDTVVDAGDTFLGDGLCQTATGACSLRAAIQESNTIPGPGEIILPPGYYLTSIAGAEEQAGATGDYDILDDLVIRGAGRTSSIVDANGLDRVFHIPQSASDVSVHLLDLTMTGGAATSFVNSFDGLVGGGIQNWGKLTLSRCIVDDNEAPEGGGIANRGRLVVEDCVVSNNQTVLINGGIVEIAGGIASRTVSSSVPVAELTIRRSAIVNNTGPFYGGGLHLGFGRPNLVENTTVSGNSAPQVYVMNNHVDFPQTTIVGGTGAAIEGRPGLPSASHIIGLSHTALDGSPACDIDQTFLGFQISYIAPSASNDLSCALGSDQGFSEGVPLDLAPLRPVGSSWAHLPGAGSPLIDTGRSSECLPVDQVGTPRPLDGDTDGSSECDIGAIEVPEPTGSAVVAVGVLLATSLARGKERRRTPC